MQSRNGRAVVLGAGIAGLLTAGLLTDVFEQVILVERDPVPAPGQHRRGAPQSRHAHALMPRGMQIIEELFPGITDEMINQGAVLAEPLADYRFTVGGHPLRRVPIGVPAVHASRPFLEARLRDRVTANAGINTVPECDVVGLIAADSRETITGVRIIRRAAGSAEETLPADLVLDALGRGARTPAWLQELGYPRPPETDQKIDLGYASTYLRLRPEHGDGLAKAVGIGPAPGHARGMMLLSIEDGRHILTLTGFGPGHRPPVDPDGFVEFAATVAPPDVQVAIRSAQFEGTIAAYRCPTSQRRHYERLTRFPAGLLVLGDALCSFNPIYAQGITVAAQQALALRNCLRHDRQVSPGRFFRTVSRIVTNPWRAAVGADLALPEIAGRHTAAVRFQGAHTRRVLAAGEHDDLVAAQFMRVIGLLDPPSSLLRPSILRRVLRPRTSPDARRGTQLPHPQYPGSTPEGDASV